MMNNKEYLDHLKKGLQRTDAYTLSITMLLEETQSLFLKRISEVKKLGVSKSTVCKQIKSEITFRFKNLKDIDEILSKSLSKYLEKD